jgi:putative spermidine/putrescine transport system substrate-binding protein
MFMSIFIVLSVGIVSGAEKTVVFCGWGGAYQEHVEKFGLKPFTEETGIKVISVSPTDYGKIKSMVESKNVEWDVVSVGGGQAVTLANYLEDIDYSKIDSALFDKGTTFQKGVGTLYYSYCLAWNKDAFPDDHPKTWADFWDVKKYPGPRGMYKQAISNIEIALFAAGYKKDDIYPLTDEKLDVAFQKLDELKPNIQFWGTGAEHAQWIADGTVTMTVGWSNRFQALIAEGAPIDFTWDGGVLAFDAFIVLKGAPHKEEAQQLVAYLSRPDVQLRIGSHSGHGSTTPSSYDGIDPSTLKDVCSAPGNMANQKVIDFTFWGDQAKRDAIEERYTKWLMF